MGKKASAYRRALTGHISLILLFVLFSSAVMLYFAGETKHSGTPPVNSAIEGEKLPTEGEGNSTENYMPVIVIDPGHGGIDSGAVGIGGLLEKNVNLTLSLILRDYFEEVGYTVLMTRTEDIMPQDPALHGATKKRSDLSARINVAKNAENVVFVSIHMNKFPESKYSGLQVYYSPVNRYSYGLAEAIQSFVRDALQTTNDRQIKNGSGLFLLDRLSCPAVIVECGFVSNPAEAELLQNDDYINSLAAAIFNATDDYIINSGYGNENTQGNDREQEKT